MKFPLRSRVVGVTIVEPVPFGNRQENLRGVVSWKELYPVFETQNPFDAQAIKLFADAERLRPVGYLPRAVAAAIRELGVGVDSLRIVALRVADGEKGVIGCNVRIELVSLRS